MCVVPLRTRNHPRDVEMWLRSHLYVGEWNGRCDGCGGRMDVGGHARVVQPLGTINAFNRFTVVRIPTEYPPSVPTNPTHSSTASDEKEMPALTRKMENEIAAGRTLERTTAGRIGCLARVVLVGERRLAILADG